MQQLERESSRDHGSRRSVVLVIDDEVGPRESLRMTLASEHEVLTADGARAALEILRSRPVDLVTVDLNMPGIKGNDLVEILRREFAEVEIIIITGFATIEAAVTGIRGGVSDFLTKPFDVVQVSSAVNLALHRQRGRRRLVRFLEGMGDVAGRDRTADQILHELENNEPLQHRLQALLDEPEGPSSPAGEIDPGALEFLELLAATIENRDPDMRGHARRVSFYAGLIADRMKLDDQQRADVRIAAFLHDLGKVGLLPDAAPIGEVVPATRRGQLEEHAEMGEKLLRALHVPAAITESIRHHHERWDGTGYPDRLRAERTPLLSRIISVADAFDAMVCNQAHAPSVGREAALRELSAEAGHQFDPQVVGVLCEIAQIPGNDQSPSEVESVRALESHFDEDAHGDLAS